VKKRYSVRVYLRHPIYLEVESNLDDDRDAVFDAVSALMLRENRDTAVYESVNREAEPDIILRKDGSVRYPRAVGHRREYPRLKVPYTNNLLDYAALVDPGRLKAHLTHLGWTFEPWGDGIEVGRFGGIVCQIPTSNHLADYDFSVAQIPEKMAAHNPAKALKLAAWIAREYHQAMYDKWKAVGS
jgi:hypothetical protein